MRALAFALVLLAAPAAPAPAAAAEAPPPQAEAELDKARRALQQQRYHEAARSFRQADKLAGGRCADCQLGLAKALNRVPDHLGALAAADAALAAATDDFLRAHALHERGLALLALGPRDAKRYEQAAEAFAQVLAMSGGSANAARVNRAEALLRLERKDEAVKLLEEYLKREPDGPSAARARELLGGPAQVRTALLPDFALETLAGAPLHGESFRGKVLLLDFWATWCGPCVAAVPRLRRLAGEMAGEPFALVSVSVDSIPTLVEKFVARHKMDWPQVWDQGSAFTRSCGVHSYPTYLLVNHAGEVVYRKSGWSSGVERQLRKEIATALAAAKAAATAAR